jgi:hypothetical protein
LGAASTLRVIIAFAARGINASEQATNSLKVDFIDTSPTKARDVRGNLNLN